jgi:hypothetical protein
MLCSIMKQGPCMSCLLPLAFSQSFVAPEQSRHDLKASRRSHHWLWKAPFNTDGFAEPNRSRGIGKPSLCDRPTQSLRKAQSVWHNFLRSLHWLPLIPLASFFSPFLAHSSLLALHNHFYVLVSAGGCSTAVIHIVFILGLL